MVIEFTQAALIGLLTLTILEVVLGIDNIVFISILADKVKEEKKQILARRIGLWMGMVVRIILLFFIKWIMDQESNSLFVLFEHDISVKDLIMILGGLFLLVQSTREIHEKLRNKEVDKESVDEKTKMSSVIWSLFFLNVVFSLDSVITAVGMADQLWVMIAAVILSMAVMLLAAKPIADFVNGTPSIKILALSFLVLIGVSLIAEGMDQHFEKGYIYFAMAFSFLVELINLRLDKNHANKNKK